MPNRGADQRSGRTYFNAIGRDAHRRSRRHRRRTRARGGRKQQVAQVPGEHLHCGVFRSLPEPKAQPAGWRYVEFFTANIRNPHTRRAYARVCARFFAWCEERGLTLTTIRRYDVATNIEGRDGEDLASRFHSFRSCG